MEPKLRNDLDDPGVLPASGPARGESRSAADDPSDDQSIDDPQRLAGEQPERYQALEAANAELEARNQALQAELARRVGEQSGRVRTLEVANAELEARNQALDAELTGAVELFERAPVGYLVVAGDGSILRANDAMASMLGHANTSALVATPFQRCLTEAQHAEFETRFADVLRNQGSQTCELVIRRNDGSGFDALVRCQGVAIPDSRGCRALVIVHDISERKRAWSRYETLFHHAIDGFCVTDAEGRHIEVNDAYCDLVAYPRDEVSELRLGDIEETAVPGGILRHMREANAIGLDRFETRLRRKDGQMVDVAVSLHAVQGSAPADRDRFFLFLRDVTVRKRVDRAQRAERSLFVGGRMVAFRWAESSGWPVTYVSPNVVEQFGHSPEALTSGELSYFSLVHPDDRRRLVDAMERDRRGSPPWPTLEYRLAHANGDFRWVEDQTQPIVDVNGRITEYRGFLLDITPRRRIEAALRASEERLSVLSEATFDGMGITEDGRLVEANRQFCELLGCEREALVGRDLVDLVVESERAAARHRVESNFTSPYEVRVVRGDGTTRTVEAQGRTVHHNGRSVRVSVLRDVGERPRIAETSEQHNELLFGIFEHLPIGAFVVDAHGKILHVNRRFIGLTGCEPETVPTLEDWLRKAYPDDGLRAKARDCFGALDTPEAHDPARAFVLPTVCGAQDLRNLEHRTIRLGGGLSLWTAIDVSGREGPDHRARHAERLEAVGQVVGGLAHDFNNHLAGVLGYADMLRTRLDDDQLTHYADKIVEGARRSTRLTSQLLAFAARERATVARVDLNSIVDEAAAYARRELEASVRIEARLEAQPSVVSGDATLLRGIVVNLAMNAGDAMPKGGDMRLQTRTVSAPEETKDALPWELGRGRYVELRVVDSGVGMDDETQRQIYDPFFTGRPDRRGGGIGLTAVQRAVRRHGGAIHVQSAPGRGTTFTVWLPLWRDPDGAEPPTAAADAVEPDAASALSVLCVDYDSAVRDVINDMLTALGHKVVTCASAEAALATLGDGSRDFDVAIFDLSLPTLAGSELHSAFRSACPRIGAILLTGPSPELDGADWASDPATVSLQKPFEVRQLVDALERLRTA